MAAELAGGALLSASLNFLFERLGSPEVLAYIQGKSKRCDFEEILGKLKLVLNSVTAVLDDAEQKQIHNRGVEKWLEELQNAFYDADDLLDEIETDALQLKVEAESKSNTGEIRKSKKEKIYNLFSKSYNSNNCRDLERKIKKILGRLENVRKEKDFLGLKERARERPSRRLPSTSLLDEPEVYGRDDVKDTIIHSLLSDDKGSATIGVIPIVGMGGLGKTTLAQLVYNDGKVNECFELKAWVCVSEEFDVCRVTKTLLQSVSSSFSDDVMDLNLLQVLLKERLRGKKFLVVLDDVWCQNSADLNVMFKPFRDGARGSKILITTRSEKVASIMGTVQSHYLRELSNEASWKLFAKYASNISGDFAANADLEAIGREIVQKCKGLPLAVKTLGALLGSTLDVRGWDRILKSEIWDLPDEESNILPALRLSYHYLPSYLKRCFAYCSLFPKNYEFEEEQMVLLWMAEGLLPNSSRDKRREEWGEEYFNDLVSRSFFQRSSTQGSFSLWHAQSDFRFRDETKSTKKFFFVMHDLMHDLAKFVAKEFCLQLEDGNSREIVKKARHLAYITTGNDPYKRFKYVLEATHLRTFLPVRHFDSTYMDTISVKVVNDLLLKPRRLRVLSLSGYQNVRLLPDSIGEQRHLRFLDLSYTSISILPESISRLYNLEALKLYFCRSLEKLPMNMHHLINLRYLDVRFCNLVEMPRKIRNLKSLQILSSFIVGKDSGTKIGELGELSYLRGELSITKLENVPNAKDVLDQAKLVDKKHLETLKLGWSYYDDSTHARDVLDMLSPNRTLRKLIIHQYPGTGFPNWIGCYSMANIVFLELSGCRYCFHLPPLGQLPSLKTLYILGFDAVVTVGPEFYGDGSVTTPFSSLEILKFTSMPSWKKWIPMQAEDVGTFAKLRELEISDCNEFIGDFPCFLVSLTKLTIKCKNLVFSLPRMPCVRDIELDGYANDQLQVVSFFEALKKTETSPQHLRISNCSSLIPVGCLPTTLETLHISWCKKLEFPLSHLKESLKVLTMLGSCESLRSFPLNSFPKLKQLSIYCSESLESLSVSDGLCEDLRFLSSLHIKDCLTFVSFPEAGLSAPNLTSLEIENCEKLKSLPEKMQNLLPSLKFLFINDCPEIESFPENGLPFSLSTLYIWDCCKLIASRVNWNIQTLPNLTTFSIGSYEDVESFPEVGLLPNTITSLSIGRFPCLKALDKNGLQELTSLKKLDISDCLELQKIPEEGFPISLEHLSISSCPLLEKKCNREKGQYWSKIDRIFCVKIGDDIMS